MTKKRHVLSTTDKNKILIFYSFSDAVRECSDQSASESA